MKSPEYHVGAGLFGGIYAGTLTAPNKNGLRMWRNRSNVTDEAIEAVMQCFKAQMENEGVNCAGRKYTFRDGSVLKVDFELVAKSEESVNEK